MICFRDRTYCPYFLFCTHGMVCDRALTIGVRTKAKQSGLPIAEYAEEPDCFEPFMEDYYNGRDTEE